MGRTIERKKTSSSTGVVVLGFVFVGGCGTNNARRFMASVAPEDFPYLYILVANTDGPQLKEFFDSAAVNLDLDDRERANLGKWTTSIDGTKQLTILELGESGNGAGGDPEIGRRTAEARREDFEEWMRPLQAVIISGGAGKGTGGGALPVIQKIARDLDKSPLTIVTMPFSYEGGGRMKKAVAALNALCNQGPTMPIYNENVPQDLTKGRGFKDVFDSINRASLLPVFFGLREVTQVVGDMQNLDIADWRKVLSGGNYVTCDYREFDTSKEGGEDAGKEDIKLYIERLLRQDPYQDHRTRRNANGMLAWAHGAWNPDEVRSVIKAATDELNPAIADDFEVFPGIHTGNDATKWMMILSVAPKGPGHEPVHSSNGTATFEVRTSTIYIPIEGKLAPAEVKVVPEVAERWKSLYRKSFGDLSPGERQEYKRLAAVISDQTGKMVFCPAG